MSNTTRIKLDETLVTSSNAHGEVFSCTAHIDANWCQHMEDYYMRNGDAGWINPQQAADFNLNVPILVKNNFFLKVNFLRLGGPESLVYMTRVVYTYNSLSSMFGQVVVTELGLFHLGSDGRFTLRSMAWDKVRSDLNIMALSELNFNKACNSGFHGTNQANIINQFSEVERRKSAFCCVFANACQPCIDEV